jgi:hypothetical protein
MQYQSFSGGGVQTFGTSSPFPLAGQIEDGIAADPQTDPGETQVTSVELEPLGGGTSTTVSVASNETYLGFNGVGVLLAQNTSSGVDIVLRVPGASDQVLAALGDGSIIGGALVDDDGMLFGFEPSGATSGPIYQVWYIDFGAASATLCEHRSAGQLRAAEVHDRQHDRVG